MDDGGVTDGADLADLTGPTEVWTMGELLAEVMRPERGLGLDRPAPFLGPFPSGAPGIFIDTVARLGVSAGIVGAVGDDPFGRCITERLARDGVRVDHVAVVPGYATGVAFVAYAAGWVARVPVPLAARGGGAGGRAVPGDRRGRAAVPRHGLLADGGRRRSGSGSWPRWTRSWRPGRVSASTPTCAWSWAGADAARAVAERVLDADVRAAPRP